MGEIVGATPSVRMSVGALAAVGAQSCVLAVVDRRQPGCYDGKHIVVNGETRVIAAFSAQRECTLDAPWSAMPAVGDQYVIFDTEPDRWGKRWRVKVADWWSALGNGGGGQVRLEYDRSAAADWTDPVRMADIAPRATPGQNSNDAEATLYAQTLRWISNNSLRTPPRPGDGNLLIPGEQHTGTDGSALDVGPELSLFRDVFNPAPWSILGGVAQSFRNSADQHVIGADVYFRVKSAIAGEEDIEFVIVPRRGTLQYVFGGAAGFCVEDKTTGGQTPMHQRGNWSPGINGAPGYNWQSGLWYRSGDVCTVWGDVSVTGAPPGPGDVWITGLPFAGSGGGPQTGCYFGQVDSVNLGPYQSLTGRVNGATLSLIRNRFDGGTASFVPHECLTSGSRFVFTASYRVG